MYTQLMLHDDDAWCCAGGRCPASTSATLPSADIAAAAVTASTSSTAVECDCRPASPPPPLQSSTPRVSLDSTPICHRDGVTWRVRGADVASAVRLVRRRVASNHTPVVDARTRMSRSSDRWTRTRLGILASTLSTPSPLRPTAAPPTKGVCPMTTATRAFALFVFLLMGGVAALTDVRDANATADPLLQLCGRALTGEVRRICGTTQCRHKNNDDLSRKTLTQVRSHNDFFKCCTNRCRRSHIEAFCCGGDASMVTAGGDGGDGNGGTSTATLYRTHREREPESPHIVLIDEASDAAAPLIRFDVDEAAIDEAMRRHRRRQPLGHRRHHHSHHHPVHDDDDDEHQHQRQHGTVGDRRTAVVADTARMERALRRYELAVDGRPVSGTLAERIQRFRNRARAFDADW